MTLPNYGIPDQAAAATDLSQVVTDNTGQLGTVVNALADATAGPLSANERDIARVRNAMASSLRAAAKRNGKALDGLTDQLSAQLTAAQNNAAIQTARIAAQGAPSYAVWQNSYVDGSGRPHVCCYVLPDGAAPRSSADVQLTHGQTLADANAYADACIQAAAPYSADCPSPVNSAPSVPPNPPSAPIVPPAGPSIPLRPPQKPAGPTAPRGNVPCGPERECFILPGAFSVWFIP